MIAPTMIPPRDSGMPMAVAADVAHEGISNMST